MNTAIPIWQILAFLGAFLCVTLAWGWFRDKYEVTWAGRLPRFTRRWYSLGAWVRLKSAGRKATHPERFEVLEWGDDSTEVPWLCVLNIDFAGYAEFGPPHPRWMPAEDFIPFAVRRFRPVMALGSLFAGHPVSPFTHDTLPPAPPLSFHAEVDA
jgi:hypothetical protein